LLNYWTGVLQQQQSDLSRFLSEVQSSLFLLPFDATSSPGGQALTSLMNDNTNTDFPPPLACYPSLSSGQLSQLNTLETTIFNLSPSTPLSDFDSSCFPDRPVYGVVDLLRLRLPFPDSRTGVAKQAAVLTQDALSRVVIYSGEVVSAFPGASTVPPLTDSTTDPRQFGTVDHMNHVLLNYLSSIANVALAMELVQFVLNGSSLPPSSTSPLFASISSIPILEFSVFGSVQPVDIASSVSSFSTPSGALFFGSNAGQAFRTWALIDSSESVAWAQSATSSEIVREGAATNSVFESVWTPASELLNSGSTSTSLLNNVTQSLASLNLFTSM